MSGEVIRPLRRSLSSESVAFMAEQRAAGLTPAPVHLMLVRETSAGERGETGCGGGLGEWVTGDATQVTCLPCLELVHA